MSITFRALSLFELSHFHVFYVKYDTSNEEEDSGRDIWLNK
ncbi:hypothetical protein [Sodalis endosymbiont of Henestaris halophilus]|nr:hypothetical protein HBA_0311 [Sodalis endosymbiont of Henestaris halophilus]